MAFARRVGCGGCEATVGREMGAKLDEAFLRNHNYILGKQCKVNVNRSINNAPPKK